MKGYDVQSGYMGWLPSENSYQLFEDEGSYTSYFRECEE